MSDGEGYEEDGLGSGSIPTFGVPKRIPLRDVPFVVAAGLPLLLIFWGILGAVVEDLGIAMSADNPLVVAGLVVATGLGPAIAYHFVARLRRNGVSLGVGCGSLVAWTILLGTGAMAAGYVGAALGAIAGVLIAARLTRPRPPPP